MFAIAIVFNIGLCNPGTDALPAQVEFQSYVPSRDVARRIGGWVGYPVSVEVPYLWHRQVVDTDGFEQMPKLQNAVARPRDADEARTVLETWVREANTRAINAGRCERYAVSFEDTGAYLVATDEWGPDGCRAYTSPLDQTLNLDAPRAAQSHKDLTRLFQEQGVSLAFPSGLAGLVDIAPGMTLRDVLIGVQTADPRTAWVVESLKPWRNREGPRYGIVVNPVGKNLLDLDPEDYPFHWEHEARAIRARNADPAAAARRDAMIQSRHELLRTMEGEQAAERSQAAAERDEAERIAEQAAQSPD